jgi:RecA-family ATPase
MTHTNADLDAQILALDRKREEAGKLSTFTPDVWHGLPVPRRQWCVEGFIPHDNVTTLNGDGGLGKTLLAMQLQVGGALGAPWLGVQMEPTRSLGIYCEDDADELHRRMVDIAAHYGTTLDALEDVHLASRVGEENLLVRFDKNDVATPTPLYHELTTQAFDLGVRLVVLDSLHDLFGGNEIMRTHARQFVGYLRRLALRMNGAVLLCAHPSLAGMNSGTGSSGSTAWNNAVRSRLYLTKPAEDGGDNKTRLLKTVKANYGPLGSDVELIWQRGVFVRNSASSDPYGEAAQVFLACLDKIRAEGRYASPSKGSPAYAPKLFVRMPQAKGITRKKLEGAMDQLLAQGRINVGSHRKPNRHFVEAISDVSAT